MKRELDWGTWLSMTAVVIVCVVVAVKVLPGTAAPEAETGAAEPTEKAAAKNEKGSEKAEPAAAAVADAGIEAARAPLPPGYRLSAPDSTFVLPTTLNEISGLSASKDPSSLWAVHDERPTLFRISVKDGSVLQEVELGKKGDYEGVEEVGDLVYVARSEGVLYAVDPRGGAEPEKLSFQKELGLACDLEGIALEPKKKRLLLTCKNESSKSRKSNKAFEIYGMDLESKTVASEAVYVINEKAIDDYIAAHPDDEGLKKSKGKDFAPSGIAVHPKTDEIYVLSTRGKMVAVLDPKGTLVRAYPLDPAIHPQPEGIAFGADGTLFVSSEAHGKRALLLVFKAP